MIEIRRILCPVDFSDTSRLALDYAVSLARWYEATLSVIYVHPLVAVTAYAAGITLVPGALMTADDRTAMTETLKNFAAEEVGASVPMECHLGEGDAGSEIVAAADLYQADLIVIGTHGRSGFKRLTMGSVTEKVLRSATRPVLTVSPQAAGVVPLPTQLFRHVLCAIDFGDASMRGLSLAMKIAQEAGGQLTVVHVSEPLPQPGPGLDDVPGVGGQSIHEHIARLNAERETLLRDAVPATVREFCRVNTVMASGKPQDEVLRLAAERSADLIVIGMHGRNVIDRFFFGSTAQHIVRHAACPVLSVRSE
jgi:nucleotide-binding universal stress UspA family protein